MRTIIHRQPKAEPAAIAILRAQFPFMPEQDAETIAKRFRVDLEHVHGLVMAYIRHERTGYRVPAHASDLEKDQQRARFMPLARKIFHEWKEGR